MSAVTFESAHGAAAANQGDAPSWWLEKQTGFRRNEHADLFLQVRDTLSKTQRKLDDIDDELSIRYFEVIASRVDPLTREASRRVRDFCAKQLSAPWAVSIIWVQQELPENLALRKQAEREYGKGVWDVHRFDVKVFGWSKRLAKEIHIRHDRYVWDVMHTVAHEMKHVMQPFSWTDEEMEADACTYADQVIAEISANPGLIGY